MDNKYYRRSIREKFNDSARSIGNKVYPKNLSPSNRIGLSNEYKGLGDLLTTEIRGRHIGTALGALVPFVTWDALNYVNGFDIELSTMCAVIDCILSFPASIGCSITGYAVGLQIEYERAKRKQK